MRTVNYNIERKILLLFIILITISFSNLVFAETRTVHGLKSATNPDQPFVTCVYNPVTNNCVLSGTTSGITSYYIVDNADIYVVGIDTNPNLIIGSKILLKTACKKTAAEEIIDDYNFAGIDISNTPSSYSPSECVFEDANLNISDFNSIVVNNNSSLTILLNTDNDVKVSSDIIISTDANFVFKTTPIITRCIDLNLNNPKYSSELALPAIDFSESRIYNNGSFYFPLYSHIVAATATDDVNLCSADGRNDSDITLQVSKQKIVFGDIDNVGEGNMRFDCYVYKDWRSKEDIKLINPICDFTFNNFSGTLPSKIQIDNPQNSVVSNYGVVKLSTCDELDVPSNISYNNICKFVYVRDNNAYTPINGSEIGVDNDAILSLSKTCNTANITGHIAQYLFTSDSNITTTPIVFGTINSAINSEPIAVSLTTGDNNHGLYNIKSSTKITLISNQTNTFFKLFLIPSNSIDTNLLDSYLFRFKLNANPGIGYPNIELDYPFKIHKWLRLRKC